MTITVKNSSSVVLRSSDSVAAVGDEGRGGPQGLPGGGANDANLLSTDEAMKLSEGGKRAYNFLKPKGIISNDGLHRDPAPAAYTGSMFEFHFDRPASCVIIPRDLLPASGMDKAIRTAAIRHAEANTDEAIQDMFEFISNLLQTTW